MAPRYDPRQEPYRDGFRAYLKQHYSEKNTIESYVNKVFYLWNKRGESVFWSAARSDEKTLQKTLEETLETYNPKCAKETYLKDHMRCFRRFREYISQRPEYPNK